MSLTGYPWLDLLIAVAAGVTAFGVLFKAVVRPLWRFQKKVNTTFDTTIPRLADIAESAPTILAIAAELRNNGGASIKDSIDRIESMASATATTLSALSEYTHTNNHKMTNALQLLGLQYTDLDGRVHGLSETVKEQGDLRDIFARWAPSPPTTSPKENP